MSQQTEPFYQLEASLAESIAAVMADGNEPAQPDDQAPSEDMADLFLEELNRLWADPAPLSLS